MALELNGSSGQSVHGNVASLHGVAQATFMGWFYFLSVSANDTVFWKGTTFTFIVVNATTDWRLATTAANLRLDAPPGNGVWVHLAIVYDGSLAANDRIKVYQDGTLVSSVTVLNAAATTLSTNATDFELGGDENSAGSFVQMRVAHWKMWTAALNASEVLQDMYSVFPVRTADLKWWSPFDDGTAPKDYSGNGNHGTTTGVTQVAGPPIGFHSDVMVV